MLFISERFYICNYIRQTLYQFVIYNFYFYTKMENIMYALVYIMRNE